jgi:hypothetical protein
MTGDPGWGWFKSVYLARLGVPTWWSRVVLYGTIAAAVFAGVAGLHGLALAVWCIAVVATLVVLIPQAWHVFTGGSGASAE